MLTQDSPQAAFHVLAYVRALLMSAFIIVTFVLLVPLQALMRHLCPKVAGLIQNAFCRTLCTLIGVKVRSRGFLPENKTYLIVANHVSWTDIIALASVAPMSFLAKSEVATWPLLGTLARLQGTVFIKRGDRQQLSLINAELARLLQDGTSLAVFPEGTSTHGVLRPRFNSSHFEAAQLADATIMPVAIFYADEAGQADVGWYGDMTFLPHLWRLLKKNHVECHLHFDEAIPVQGRDRKSLALESQERVHRMLIEARDKASGP